MQEPRIEDIANLPTFSKTSFLLGGSLIENDLAKLAESANSAIKRALLVVMATSLAGWEHNDLLHRLIFADC
jgi:hypothetical protein